MNISAKIKQDRQILLILALLTIVMGLMRSYTYDEPFERDITTHAVIAHELLNGKTLYEDIWSDRTPLIQWTYALGEVIMGYGLDSIYFLWILSAFITLCGVYACAVQGGGRPVVGLWAAGFWVAVSCAPMVQANQPNAEVFINNCMIWVLALILSDDGKGDGRTRAVVIGILLSLGSFYKTHVVLMAVLLGIAHIANPPGGIENRKRSINQACITAGVGVLAWASLLVFMHLTDRFDVFWNAIYSYMRHYGGSISENLFRGMHPIGLMPNFLFGISPLIVLSVLGAGLSFKNHSTRTGTLYACYGFAVVLMVSLPGKFFPHYYQFWLPFLAICSAKTLELIAFREEKNASGIKFMGMAVILLIFVLQSRYFLIPSKEWARLKYGELFVETQQVGRVINDVLKPDETFFNWGLDSGLYFYSQKPIPSGAGIWLLIVMGGPLTSEFIPKIQEDLRSSDPELLIVSDYLPKRKHPLFQWLMERYEIFPDNSPYKPFEMYYRKGGALEKRIALNESEKLKLKKRRMMNPALKERR